MKPIYMAPTLDQADDIKQLLKQGGVETSLVKQADPNNALAPKGITWFELWLKRETDYNKAEIIIEQFEFSQLKNNLKLNWIYSANDEAAAVAEEPATKPIARIGSNLSKNQRDEVLQAAYDSWLPVNNQKVFGRLANMLGFSDDEISKGEFNNIRRPWSPDRLKSQVDALQELCKAKANQEALGNS